ncbi:MAG: hypothetical protein AB3N14_12585 [Flavobacteriaceae bacterium]
MRNRQPEAAGFLYQPVGGQVCSRGSQRNTDPPVGGEVSPGVLFSGSGSWQPGFCTSRWEGKFAVAEPKEHRSASRRRGISWSFSINN